MNLEKNIWKLHTIKFILWFMLYMPTLILFLSDNGLTVQQIFILHACGSLTICFSEIPTGVLGDLMGRKKSIAIGFLFITLGFLLYSISNHFLTFIPAIISIGIGQSFISGSDTALLYESLKSNNKMSLFSKFEGKNVAIGNISEAIAFIFGGYLALYSLRAPFIIQTVIAFTGFFIALTLKENNRPINVSRKKVTAQFNNTIYYIWNKNKLLKQLIFFSTVMGVATLTMAWLVQFYFKSLNLTANYFGIIGSLLNVFTAIGAIITHKLKKRISTIILFSTSLTGISLGYIIPALNTNLLMLLFFGILYFSRGIVTTAIRTSINHQTPSLYRASVMSVRSLGVRFFHAIFAPFLGYINTKFSFQSALLFAGSSIVIFGSISLLAIYKNQRFKAEKNNLNL